MRARLLRLACFALIIAPVGCALVNPKMSVRSRSALSEGIEIQDQRLALPGAVPLAYRIYRDRFNSASPVPEIARGDWVILAHGFLRDQDKMRDLAMALARAGFQVATLNFNHGSPINGGHVRNGQDMIALARHLQATRVVYAGFSAGGLAALLAARTDSESIGVLTLDLVDSQSLGYQAARGLDVPVVALAGDPSNCNANRNAGPIYKTAPNVRLETIPKASHCDFESPTDRLCTLLCEQPDEQNSAGRREAIIQASVRGVRELFQSVRPA